MLVLITNDDGISAAGLVALGRAALEAGLDVVVAAPSWDSSGSSASLSAVEDHGRLVLRSVPLDGLPVLVGTVYPEGEDEPGSDAALLRESSATVSALRPLCTDDVDVLDSLIDAFDGSRTAPT